MAASPFLLSEVLGRLVNRVAIPFASETLAAAKVLTKLDRQLRKIDPGGAARNVDLPAVTKDDQGYWFFLGNATSAAELLTVRNAAGATIATINQSEAGIVYVDAAGAWQVFGVLTYSAT